MTVATDADTKMLTAYDKPAAVARLDFCAGGGQNEGMSAEGDSNNNELTARQVIGRPFLPGQSGNPAGRPKKNTALTTALRNQGNPVKLAKMMWKLALKDEDLAAARYIYDRLEGMPKQVHELDISLVREKARLMAEVAGVDPIEAEDNAERLLLAAGDG